MTKVQGWVEIISTARTREGSFRARHRLHLDKACALANQTGTDPAAPGWIGVMPAESIYALTVRRSWRRCATCALPRAIADQVDEISGDARVSA